MTSAIVTVPSDLEIGPFQTTDPAYDFWSDAHCLAAEQLDFAIGSMIMLTVFSGAPGSGKSTVLRKVVDVTQDKRLIGALPHSPKLSVAPCRAILGAFGADPGQADEQLLRPILERSLLAAKAQHGLPTLIIDDAHHLDDASLERIFDLAALERGPEEALFKIVLVGDDDLLERVKPISAEIIGPSFTLEPMSESDTADYVRHRLAAANYKAMPFSDDALKAVFEFSKGNALKTSILCTFALAEFKGRKSSQINAGLVRKCFGQAREALREPTKAGSRGVLALRAETGPMTPHSETPALSDPAVKEPRAGVTADAGITPSGANDPDHAVAGGRTQKSTADPAAKDAVLGGHEQADARPTFQSSRTRTGKAWSTPSVPDGSEAGDAAARALETDLRETPQLPAAQAKAGDYDLDAIPAPKAESERHKTGAVAIFSGLAAVAFAAAIFATGTDFRGDSGTSRPASPDAALPEAPASVVTAPVLITEAADADTDPVAEAPEPRPEIATDENAIRRMIALAKVLDPFPEDPGARFRKAVTIATQNPEAAAVAYALAAEADHPRAAYFLGQMYEIGEGVPVDMIQARAWYDRAGDRIDGARDRAADLRPADAALPQQAPLPLYAQITADGRLEVAWTSAEGPDPREYVVEFADRTGNVVHRVDRLVRSALSTELIATARYWRVAVLRGPASGWVPIEPETTGAVDQQAASGQ